MKAKKLSLSQKILYWTVWSVLITGCIALLKLLWFWIV